MARIDTFYWIDLLDSLMRPTSPTGERWGVDLLGTHKGYLRSRDTFIG